MKWFGVDPGVSGGIAVINDRGAGRVFRMPANEKGIWQLVSDEAEQPAICVIERLGQMPRDRKTGKAMQSPSSMLKLGTNYGALQMAFVAAGVPVTLVLPAKWQAYFGLLSRPSETKTRKKNRHKATAQKLFPHLRVTHHVADALLVGVYCREAVK